MSDLDMRNDRYYFKDKIMDRDNQCRDCPCRIPIDNQNIRHHSLCSAPLYGEYPKRGALMMMPIRQPLIRPVTGRVMNQPRVQERSLLADPPTQI